VNEKQENKFENLFSGCLAQRVFEKNKIENNEIDDIPEVITGTYDKLAGIICEHIEYPEQ